MSNIHSVYSLVLKNDVSINKLGSRIFSEVIETLTASKCVKLTCNFSSGLLS